LTVTATHAKSTEQQHRKSNFIGCSYFAIEAVKGKVLPYLLPSIGPGYDPGIQAVNSRLPLLSTMLAVTFPAEERRHPSTGTKLYCLVTEARRCEQLAQGCYAALPPVRFKP